MTEADAPMPSSPIHAPPPRLEEDPADHARPILDQLLRNPSALLARIDGPAPGAALFGLFVIALLGLGVYGLVVGSFSGGTQWWAAPAKLVLGMFLCAAICFP